MFTQRHMQNLFLSAVAALLLLTTAGRSAVLTTAPPSSASPLTSRLSDSGVDGPRVQRSHTSCGSEHDSFCANGGKCIYPQDNDKPFCICTSSYGGPRCMLFSDSTRSLPEGDVIGITVGILMLVFLLAIVVYCCASRRCLKSAPLIKSAPSESSV